MQPGRALELAHHRLGELDGEGLGLAAGEIDENAGHILGLGRQVDPSDGVGLILGLGELRGARVGRPLRQRVDRRALCVALGTAQRIGMN